MGLRASSNETLNFGWVQSLKREGGSGLRIGMVCFLFWFLPGVILLDARPLTGRDGQEKWRFQTEFKGYLAHSNSRVVRLAKSPGHPRQSNDETAGVKSGVAPLFAEFLKQMQEQLAAEAENKDAERVAAAEAPEVVEPAKREAPRREVVAQTSPYLESQAAFPRPSRDIRDFEDIYLYFPVESGDAEKLGLVRGIGHRSQFSPPVPHNLKSRAVLERIQR